MGVYPPRFMCRGCACSDYFSADMKKHEPCFCEECEKARYNIPCGDHFHESFWKTVVESEEWKKWEEEQRKRFSHIRDKDCLPVFDIDECQ
jgi:hypothetical protein